MQQSAKNLSLYADNAIPGVAKFGIDVVPSFGSFFTSGTTVKYVLLPGGGGGGGTAILKCHQTVCIECELCLPHFVPLCDRHSITTPQEGNEIYTRLFLSLVQNDRDISSFSAPLHKIQTGGFRAEYLD